MLFQSWQKHDLNVCDVESRQNVLKTEHGEYFNEDVFDSCQVRWLEVVHWRKLLFFLIKMKGKLSKLIDQGLNCIKSGAHHISGLLINYIFRCMSLSGLHCSSLFSNCFRGSFERLILSSFPQRKKLMSQCQTGFRVHMKNNLFVYTCDFNIEKQNGLLDRKISQMLKFCLADLWS